LKVFVINLLDWSDGGPEPGAEAGEIDDTIDVEPLLPSIGLTWNQFWFFVNETQAVQQLDDLAFAIGDLPGLLDMVCNLLNLSIRS